MSIADLPLLNQIKGRLTWLDERQRVIAQNVANADTPGYMARDLRQPTDFASALRNSGGVQMTRTSASHMAPANPPARFAVQDSPDSETTLDGNAVVVEEQMIKIAETRMDFETMVGLYQKSLGLLRLASRSPRG